jgi:hypothetical protein
MGTDKQDATSLVGQRADQSDFVLSILSILYECSANSHVFGIDKE